MVRVVASRDGEGHAGGTPSREADRIATTRTDTITDGLGILKLTARPSDGVGDISAGGCRGGTSQGQSRFGILVGDGDLGACPLGQGLRAEGEAGGGVDFKFRLGTVNLVIGDSHTHIGTGLPSRDGSGGGAISIMGASHSRASVIGQCKLHWVWQGFGDGEGGGCCASLIHREIGWWREGEVDDIGPCRRTRPMPIRGINQDGLDSDIGCRLITAGLDGEGFTIIASIEYHMINASGGSPANHIDRHRSIQAKLATACLTGDGVFRHAIGQDIRRTRDIDSGRVVIILHRDCASGG